MILRTVFEHPCEQTSDRLRTAVFAHPLIPPERSNASERPRSGSGWTRRPLGGLLPSSTGALWPPKVEMKADGQAKEIIVGKKIGRPSTRPYPPFGGRTRIGVLGVDQRQ
jgi:hypothetical protein